MNIYSLFKTIFGQVPKHHFQDDFDIDCIIGFSFGQGKKNGEKIPGKSNEVLAEIARLYSKNGEIPLLLQWEIAESRALANYPKEKVIREQPPATYIDTYEVAVEAMKQVYAMGYNKILILAQPEHVFRCKKVLENLSHDNMEFFVPPILKAVPYSIKNKHIQTKHVVIFYVYEMLSRVFYIMKGYIK